MSLEHADALGALAGTLTTAAFVPQVLKTWKSRSAEDVSLATFFLLLFNPGFIRRKPTHYMAA